MSQSALSSGRLHIVLIPGFAGFDALGQLEYYAGVTPVFRRWQEQHQDQHPAVLHYFDNFPTAAVVTRAGRLRSYLAKRTARGEFRPGDTLALVGHSTGGLDIRWLLWTLSRDPDKTIAVDGGEGTACAVEAREILDFMRGIVFLSVPQLGTNIADWVRSHTLSRTTLVEELRAAAEASQFPFLDKVERWIAEGASGLTGLDLFRALEDSLTEADARVYKGDPSRTADAQEAASELELWLRHMSSDFSAIDDLAARRPSGTPASPAHFSSEMRDEETGLWKTLRIRTRSYATLGWRPFHFEAATPAPVWNLLEPWTYPEWRKAEQAGAETDIVYRTCYRACAGGPFAWSGEIPLPQYLNASARRQIDLLTNGGRIELWDNDGVVNTLSMFWPDAANTVLVPADHMDIVGHHKLVDVARQVEGTVEQGRKYQAYDLLKSTSGFDDGSFAQVWYDIFDFCCLAAV